MTLVSFPHGCNVTTCPNGKCRMTGECIDAIPRVPSPPLIPDGYCTETGDAWCYAATITEAGQCATCPEPVPASNPHAVPRTIIAFTGLAGAGKSTAAAHLVSRHGFQRVRFAGPLKSMMAALGLSQEQIEGSEKETPCALLGGKTPRYAMQTIGTEWGRDLIDSNLWIRAWQSALAKVPTGVGVVVDDCRFPNEAAAVQAAGGILVRIERSGAGAGAAGHVSEAHALRAIWTVPNDYSEANLHTRLDRILSDLSWADARA